MRRAVKVEVIGAINNFKLKAHVTGYIDDVSGTGELKFEYREVPPGPDWHPLNYTDPLVLLPAYPGRGKSKGKGMAQMYPSGGFRADCTLDFDNGLVLRKGANIVVDTSDPKGPVHTGGYYLFGAARSGHIDDRLGKKHAGHLEYAYREYMHPVRAGEIMGIGFARWPRLRQAGVETGKPIEAVVSTRYRFDDANPLPGHFIRTVEIPEATWNPATRTVEAVFNTRIEEL